MSRKNRITNAKAQKLRSGHTYWRCQTLNDGTVDVSEEFLKGSKYTVTYRSMFPENVPASKRKVLFSSLVIGPVDPKLWTRRNYLSSVNPGSSTNTFTSRRAALRWKQEVEAGLHPEHVAGAMEHWNFCDDMNMYDYYDRYDAFDDYHGPDNDIVHHDEDAPARLEYSEPMTLGELLRKKLKQQPQADEANDDLFALEG